MSDAGLAQPQLRAPPTPTIEGRKRTMRSRVTNGTELLPGVDGRSPTARRYRDLCASIASDLGGADHLSEAQGQLVRRFAALSVQAELMEAALVSGGQMDITEYSQLTSTLVRVATRIGINRVAREIYTPLADRAPAYAAEEVEATHVPANGTGAHTATPRNGYAASSDEEAVP